MSATTVHPIQRFGTSGGIQEVNPNSRQWQAYLGLSYAGIRALARARWPQSAPAAAAATITSLTPNTATLVAGGVQSVAVVGTGFVVGGTKFTSNGAVLQATVTSATAATIMVPRSPVGTQSIRALNPGRAPSAPSTFTVTGATGLQAPTQASTKAEIVAWLLDHGVTLSEAALMNLTKDELLELVDDVLSP